MNDMSVPAAGSRVARPAVSAGGWWSLTVLFLIFFFSMIDRYIIAMLVVPMKRSLSLSDFQISLVLGPAFALLYALCSFPMGWAADRFSRKWIVALGGLLFGLATIGIGTATGFATLLVWRMLVGIGQTAPDAAATSLLADKFPRHRLALAISIMNVGVKMGSAGAYAIGGLGLAAAATMIAAWPTLTGIDPWRLVMAFTGIPVVVVAALVLTVREPLRPQARTGHDATPGTENFLAFVRAEKRLILPLVLGFSLVAICSQSLTGWVPAYLTRHFGWPASRFGPILGAVSMAAALTLVVKGAMMDWLYDRGMKDVHVRFYTWLLAGTVPVAAVLFFVKSPPLFIILYSIVQVVAIPISAYVGTVVQVITPPRLRAQMTATMVCSMTLLGSLGPVIVGALTDFVFHDEAKLGEAMGIVLIVAFPLALLCLRSTLPRLRVAAAAAELRDA